MTLLLAAALTAGSAVAAAEPAGAASYPERVARGVEREVVFVDRRAEPRISEADAGRIRLRILRKDLGRIKIALVDDRQARRAGGVTGLAKAVGRHLELRGTLLVVGRSTVFATTSHPAVNETVSALNEAFHGNEGNRVKQLEAAVDGIAAVDPGSSADLGRPTGGGRVGNVPTGGVDDPFEDVGNAIEIGTLAVMLAVAAAILIPVLFFVVRGVLAGRRRRAAEEETLADDRVTARNDLIALGDEIRALEIDTSMPGVGATAVADYEAAVMQYDRANEALGQADSPHRLQQAQAALAEGRRRIESAKAQLARAG
ncbi:MAG TPA: hypothetical protein VF520_11595 [Thermoleophilaceae bacterium]